MKLKRSRPAFLPPRASLDEPSKTITVEPLRVPVPVRTPAVPPPPEREPARQSPPTREEPPVPTP
jgi:hypothetical protein